MPEGGLNESSSHASGLVGGEGQTMPEARGEGQFKTAGC